MVDTAIKALVHYGIEKGLISQLDATYAVNRILDVLRRDEYSDDGAAPAQMPLASILQILLDDAQQRNLLASDSIAGRDLFDTKLMGCLTPPPHQVIERFFQLYRDDPKKATDDYYRFSQDTDYIRRYRMTKDLRWTTDTNYGVLDITVNLAKPEKDPRDIIKAGAAIASGYPKCLLCRENEGYAGRLNHPARQNHRIIPLTLDNQAWFLQYSPYVYYNEHCIVLNSEHVPMKINRSTFVKLLAFVEQFPHYFLGSNADLPIVGGSILSHDHFQGGNYQFAMAKAPIEERFTIDDYNDVEAGSIHWPMYTLRLRSEKKERLIDLADKILAHWREYSDEEAFIFAHTDGVPHNTITPIARMADGRFELDLVLRNNITTEEHPMGVYHPHAELHNIKKENIGLIEVMGLAVLPARLKIELNHLAQAILSGEAIRRDERIALHADWVERFLPRYASIDENNVQAILQQEVGRTFMAVLEDAGVFKRTDTGKAAARRFVESLAK